MLRVRHILAMAFVLTSAAPNLAAEPSVVLATGGKEAMPIVVAASAGERTRAAAKTLAAQLRRITDAPLEVRVGDGDNDIVVGAVRDFPKLRGELPLIPEGRNPWKSSEPFAAAEIDKLLRDGIARHKLLDFESVSFSDDLVPATPLKLPDVEPGQYGLFFRDEFDLHTWVDAAPAELPFSVKAGLIYGRLGDAKFSLFPRDEPQGKSVANVAIAPDKQKRDVSLRSPIRGLQRLHLSDGSDGTEVTWPAGTSLTIRSNPASPVLLHGRWTLYFYVPRDTKVIGGFADGPGELRDPSGKMIHKFGDAPGYFSIPVPAGSDAKLWCFHHGNGRRLLMTVPPYLARNAKELLLPHEVVNRDAVSPTIDK